MAPSCGVCNEPHAPVMLTESHLMMWHSCWAQLLANVLPCKPATPVSAALCGHVSPPALGSCLHALSTQPFGRSSALQLTSCPTCACSPAQAPVRARAHGDSPAVPLSAGLWAAHGHQHGPGHAVPGSRVPHLWHLQLAGGSSGHRPVPQAAPEHHRPPLPPPGQLCLTAPSCTHKFISKVHACTSLPE